jgi:hypothetical protein
MKFHLDRTGVVRYIPIQQAGNVPGYCYTVYAAAAPGQPLESAVLLQHG